MLKWPYYARQSTDSMQSLSNYHCIFHRTRTNHFKFCMETQKILNSHNNLEKEKHNWMNQAPWFQTILQSYSHQNSMVLAQKQKHRSMEEDRRPRNILIRLCPTNLWQRRQGCTVEKRQPLQQVMLGKLDSYM